MGDDDAKTGEIPEAVLYEDELDALRTVEMSSFAREVKSDTRPMQPVLDATTQTHVVPDELLNHAKPTAQMEKLEWLEFQAVIDDEGRIQIPDTLRALLEHRELVVRIKGFE